MRKALSQTHKLTKVKAPVINEQKILRTEVTKEGALLKLSKLVNVFKLIFKLSLVVFYYLIFGWWVCLAWLVRVESSRNGAVVQWQSGLYGG